MKKPDFLNIFSWVYARLQPFRRRQFWMLFAAIVLLAFIETVSLGTIAFFASAVTDPASVKTSKYVEIIRRFIDAGFLNSTNGLILASGASMCILMIAKNILKGLSQYGMARYSTAMEAHFGTIFLDGFLKMPYQWHLSRNSADLINAIQWRIYLGRNFFQPTLSILNDILMVSVMLVSLFIVQPLVSFFVTVIICGSAFFIYKIIRTKIDKAATISRDYQIAIHRESTMSIQGIKDVKTSGTEDVFVSKFFQKATFLSKIFGLQVVYSNFPVLMLESIGFLMLFLSICIMLLMFNITTAYMTGIMTLLAVTAYKVLPAISQVLKSMGMIRNSLPFIQTLIKYTNQIESELKKDKKKREPVSFINAVHFRNVSFGYDKNRPKILKNVSFAIKKGETIGIIGTSGAGKSTLVDLLIGLLEAVDGTVSIDDRVLTREVVPAWLKITGYVPQFSYIYDGTLAENIAFSVKSHDIDIPLVKKCCKMAAIDKLVETLPCGIDTPIGERGVKLSGGQQQRVSIARALYKKPEVLIFDEATSSLDTNNENLIQKTIYSFKGALTLIIIAHRLSTVEGCDRILWIEKGELKMIDTPARVFTAYEKIKTDK